MSKYGVLKVLLESGIIGYTLLAWIMIIVGGIFVLGAIHTFRQRNIEKKSAMAAIISSGLCFVLGSWMAYFGIKYLVFGDAS